MTRIFAEPFPLGWRKPAVLEADAREGRRGRRVWIDTLEYCRHAVADENGHMLLPTRHRRTRTAREYTGGAERPLLGEAGIAGVGLARDDVGHHGARERWIAGHRAARGTIV